jgi:hypothetical protein
MNTPGETVTLDFDGGSKKELSLSGAASVGEYLFLAPDEGSSIPRLRPEGRGSYGRRASFPLRALLPLPGGAEDELDLEGMDYADGYLWVVGSHGGVRTKIDDDTDLDDVPGLLAQVDRPASRQVLIRLALDADDVPTAVVADTNGVDRTSAWLGDGQDGLRAALVRDRHLGAFLDTPGKDNGIDVEGLAVLEDRVLLGMRGPVLRGWAVVLEIHPETSASEPTRFRLGPVPGSPPGDPYRKHFLDLGGLGVRDLARHGDDLLILTGPTMVLDGPSRLLRLAGGAVDPIPGAVPAGMLEVVVEALPTDAGHPEGITVLDADRLLICYDAPTKARRTKTSVLADLIDLGTP